MTHPRWPRVLDILAVALVFNLCAAAPVEAAASEPPAWATVEQPFRAGQGERVGKARKAAPVYETTDVVAKGEHMTEPKRYTQAEWAARMAAEERREQASDALIAGHRIERPYLSAVIRNPRQPHFPPRPYRWEQN